eukprot:SAG31_NODE_17013_length_686_cov_1.885860_1_plen_70_part_10
MDSQICTNFSTKIWSAAIPPCSICLRTAVLKFSRKRGAALLLTPKMLRLLIHCLAAILMACPLLFLRDRN